MFRSRFFLLVLVLFAVVPLSTLHAQTYTESLVYSFCTQIQTACSDGVYPSNPVQALDGNFYGTTDYGGIYYSNSAPGNGSIYKLTPDGALTTIHSFCQNYACPDGSNPNSALVQGSDGNLYGTAFSGGAGKVMHNQGTVFKITPDGTFTTLYSFCNQTNCSDGVGPYGALVQGSDGNFYGTTLYGGAQNYGTIFKINPGGTLTTMYSFCSKTNCADGKFPYGTLVQGLDGNFYGTTLDGGGASDGTVFNITPLGALTTLYGFCSQTNCTDGANPTSALIEANDGNFYGTTTKGGANNDGTVFKITSGGAWNLIYSFCGEANCADGETPDAGLFQASDGNFYGTTLNGGTNSDGTAFKLSSGGTLSTLYSFCGQANCTDGQSPTTGLMQGTDGNLYGATLNGGLYDAGAIYKLAVAPGLAAPVQLQLTPSTAAPGASISFFWQVLNAFSTTSQQCAAFVTNGSGVTTALGVQRGSYNSTTHIYSGSATLSAPAAGTYTYALTCGGTESGLATLTVTAPSKSPSTTALSVAPLAPTVGQSATLTATVTGASGKPTGSVTFSYGSDVLHTSTLSGGVATFTASTNGLPPATYPIMAAYSGDSNYAASSGTDSVTLGLAPTTTALAVSPSSVTPPGDVTLTATVTRSSAGAVGAPTGSVTFYADSSYVLATVKVNGAGVAALTASSQGYGAGVYAITAKYNGDSSDVGSTSPAENVTVK